jgi:hypothetical protein
MSLGQTIAGIAAIGVAAQATLFGVGALIDEPKYMTVHKMTVLGPDVEVERTIHRKAIADWRVTVVSALREGPSCQTVPGSNRDEGWSLYSPGHGGAAMSLDLWAGDPGCFDRLDPGDYHMFVTWTPRDGTPPVVARADFKKD